VCVGGVSVRVCGRAGAPAPRPAGPRWPTQRPAAWANECTTKRQKKILAAVGAALLGLGRRPVRHTAAVGPTL
jgi:hypothetical protein